MFVVFMTGAISISIVFLFGCIGETITEKAGHLNLGIPGTMCAGAAGGCWGVSIYMGMLDNPLQDANWLLILLFALFFSAILSGVCGLIYALLTVSCRANQNITGLALTTFGSGFAQFFMDNIVDKKYLPAAGRVISKALPFAKNLNGVAEILLSHGVLVYLAIVIAILATVFLTKTKAGLRLRAVGENPFAADAAGINITRYKYLAILIGSAIAGFGGMFYILDYTKGSWETAAVIESYGWLSVALVIFTLWKPVVSIFGSVLFGALFIAPRVITGISFAEMKLLNILPYVVTVLVLIFTSVRGSKENQPPASLGLPYFREER
ncbi:MAG: ABC transporter permease [Clostridia bacterium]|nr:ABC transporter permease [Clostridia bacterium]